MPNQTSSVPDVPDSAEAFSTYYASLSGRPELGQCFRNVDQTAELDICREQLRKAATRNFLLDFGDEEAWCAIDLERDDYIAILSAGVR